jgi:lipoprotein signal peptidase
MKHRRAAGYALAALVLAADQGAKAWVMGNAALTSGQTLVVLPVLNFVLVGNHGITFGLLSGVASKTLLVVAALAVVAVLGIWLWRSANWAEALAIGAIAGGALGNIADRLHYSAVVDFLQMHIGGLFFPWVFNLGDAAIDCGVAALFLDYVFRHPPVAASRGER